MDLKEDNSNLTNSLSNKEVILFNKDKNNRRGMAMEKDTEDTDMIRFCTVLYIYTEASHEAFFMQFLPMHARHDG